MSFFELLDGLLTELQVPFYEGQPEFERDPPEAFITYDVEDVPHQRGDGQELTTAYHVTFSIYTSGKYKRQNAAEVEQVLTALLLDNGFIRQSGSFGLSNTFMRYYRRIIEFNYDYERT